MPPKTKHQVFKEWLAVATMDELEEELFNLDETNLSLLSQIDRYELRVKTDPPTQEDEDWRLRAGHLQRWTYYQKKAIERRIKTVKEELKAKSKAKSRAEYNRVVEESARLKSERAPKHDPEVELRRKEAARLKHERATSYDRAWIAAAKTFLDADTFRCITSIANGPTNVANE